MQEDGSCHRHRIFVGLGNPGTQYELTRHNLGKMVVQCFARELGWIFKKETNVLAEAAKGTHNGTTLHLVLPTTYMNDSGTAVRRYLSYYRLPVDELVVVTDDTAFPLGSLKLKEKGSAGGHNGLKSIEEQLGTQRYARLRMGIGQPLPHQEMANYVLEKFRQAEVEHLSQAIMSGCKALQCIADRRLDQAMNVVNQSSG